MKRLVVVLAALAALAVTGAAAAHPLGNFTVNRYSRIEPAGNRVYVLYAVDMAEIPTFQAKSAVQRLGEPGYADSLARAVVRGTELRVDGRPARLRALRRVLAFPPGQAGLHTTRFEVVLATAPLAAGPHRIAYEDRNFSGRIGWKEIVVRPGSGDHVVRSDAPATSVSEELIAYPKNLLQSPLDVTRADARVSLAGTAAAAPGLPGRVELEQRAGVRAVADSGFAKLITATHLGAGFVLVSLLIAFFWGAAHALSPGHGKSIVAAYLVGARGTPRHAVLLGLTVTATHTIGVFALGLITLSLSQFVVPDTLYPWLNLVSALLVVAVGVSVLRWRVREWRKKDAGHDHGHGHGHHHHHHGHHHHHDHDHDPALAFRRILGVGVSGGIIPCPTALVVLLAAISLHRVAYGLVLILAFSFGLAAAITAVGLAAIAAKRVTKKVDRGSRVLRVLPAVSAIVVLGLGFAMTVRALPGVM